MFTVFDAIKMLGGLALFLYGMRIMGDGLKSSSSGAFQQAIGKVTNNPFMGFLVGLLVTAVIQSSTATIVITSGLVGAGVITLHQSLGIIIGANVGTTVTGQILRLLDVETTATSWTQIFKPETLAPIAAIIGIICIMALKKMKNSGTVGIIAMGFGILFTGLINMTAAVDPLASSTAFGEFFSNMSKVPILGFLAGLAVSLLLQSSSASVGILQSLSMGGQLSFSSIYMILFGIYLGDCITTAIVCSIGAKADARRTGIIHIMFNLAGAVIVFAVVMILHGFGLLDAIWGKSISSGGIANVNTIFKLSGAILLLPVCGIFEKLSYKIIKDAPESGRATAIKQDLAGLNTTLFRAPSLALAAAQHNISVMARLASESTEMAFTVIDKYNQETVDLINEDEGYEDTLADRTSNYLINLSPYIHIEDKQKSDTLNFYIKCINEFERIGDHAVNICENAIDLHERDVNFSRKASGEVGVLAEALREITKLARKAFEESDMQAARDIEPIEEVVDDMVAALRENHLKRLRENRCTIDSGFVFLDLLVNVERVSDQCSNIGVFTLGQSDPVIAKKQHDYLRELHQGNDEYYNEQYKKHHDYYFGKLKAIDSEVAEV